MQALPNELYLDGKVVGAKVRVVTCHDESFEGIIFTLDPIANFLILGMMLMTRKHLKLMVYCRRECIW